MRETIFEINPVNIDAKDAQFLQRLEKLDLRPIVFKLVKDPDSGIPWTERQAKSVEIEYKQYLFLYWKYGQNPQIAVAPNKRVDMFWHQHILDTEKYKKDCEWLFSKPYQSLVCRWLRYILKPLGIELCAGYMQHFPYLGLRGEKDVEVLQQAFDKGKELLSLHFPMSSL
jgi:hypothetical protein